MTAWCRPRSSLPPGSCPARGSPAAAARPSRCWCWRRYSLDSERQGPSQPPRCATKGPWQARTAPVDTNRWSDPLNWRRWTGDLRRAPPCVGVCVRVYVCGGARVWSRARSRRRACVARAVLCRAVCTGGRAGGRTGERTDGRAGGRASGRTHHAPRRVSLPGSFSLARARARAPCPVSSLVPLVHGLSTPVAISRTVIAALRVGRRVGRRAGDQSIVTCQMYQTKRDSYAHGRGARRAERKPEIRRRRPIKG